MKQTLTKPYHHGDLAESLIESAATLLADKGPSQISLREIARLAGVSHAAPAHHFSDKTGLLTAVAIRGHERLYQALNNSQGANQAINERLVAAGSAYVNFAIAEPGYFSVMFETGTTDSQSEALAQAKQLTQQVLTRCLQELSGEAADKHTIIAMQTALWSQVHGFSTLWLAGNFGPKDDLAYLKKLLADMLRSIEPRTIQTR